EGADEEVPGAGAGPPLDVTERVAGPVAPDADGAAGVGHDDPVDRLPSHHAPGAGRRHDQLEQLRVDDQPVDLRILGGSAGVAEQVPGDDPAGAELPQPAPPAADAVAAHDLF